MGVPTERIFHFYDLRKLIKISENKQKIKYYGITEQKLRKDAKTRIGLLSTDLALGGTAIALFHMAKVLKKQEYPIVFCFHDGWAAESAVGRAGHSGHYRSKPTAFDHARNGVAV